MTRTSLLVMAAVCLLPLAVETAAAARPPIREAPKVLEGETVGVGRHIPDLEYTDLRGRSGRLSDLNEDKPVVILITGTGCPLCRRYAPSLASLEQDYRDKGVRFLFVNPNRAEKQKKIEDAVSTHGFQGPYIRDVGHSIIRTLAAKTTTEAFVLDGERRLVYRGAVDDQYGFGYALDEPRRTYLRDALDALLRGQSPNVSATSAPGCELWIDDEEPEVGAEPDET